MSGPATLAIHRGLNVLTGDSDRRQRLERERRSLKLAPDQLLHAEAPAVFVVRLGRLRVSQFLDDGREVTRGVLQAGAMLDTESGQRVIDPSRDVYDLHDCVLMALGETELWVLPPGIL